MDDLSLWACVPPRLLSRPIGYTSSVRNFLMEPPTRHELIAQAAYFRAQHRGFEPGHELEDWQAAEAEVDMALHINGTTRND
jgi:Protein of unknown function (DUF2934)